MKLCQIILNVFECGSVWYQYCVIRWKYTKFLVHNWDSVKGFLWLTKGDNSVTAKTETITCPSTFISLPFSCVMSLFGLLNWAMPGYGGIITHSWLDIFMLECCSRKDVTQSIKCLTIPKWMVWRTSGMIIVVGEMHFRFQNLPSEVRTTWSSR